MNGLDNYLILYDSSIYSFIQRIFTGHQSLHQELKELAQNKHTHITSTQHESLCWLTHKVDLASDLLELTVCGEIHAIVWITGCPKIV